MDMGVSRPEYKDKKLACLDVLLIESSNTIEFSELGREAGSQRRDEIGNKGSIHRILAGCIP
jgi:hypothetical protein